MDGLSANSSIQALHSSLEQAEYLQEHCQGAGAAATSQAHNSIGGAAAAAAAAPTQSRRRTGRWIRITVASIKAILFLELASMVAGPIIASRAKQDSDKQDDTESDLDPADVLMDYLTGKTGLAALQLLRPDQLRAAVDNLITEDYEELGVKDRGAELRNMIDDIMQARQKGKDTPSSRNSQRQQGLGRVGPVRFRNTKQALAKEVSPPTAAEAATAEGSTPGSTAVTEAK